VAKAEKPERKPGNLEVKQIGPDVIVLVQGTREDADRIAEALRGVNGLARATDVASEGSGAGRWAIRLLDAHGVDVLRALEETPPI
jgi:hypothetical protein